MRRKGILALAAIAGLMLVTGVAAAAKTYTTHINVRSVSKNAENPNVMFAGDLHSLNKGCRAERKVKFFKATNKTSSGFKLLDTDRSSAKSAFAVEGNLNGEPTVKLRVTGRTLQNGVVCKGRTENISPSNY